MAGSSELDLGAIADAGARERERLGRRRLGLSFAVSAAVTAVWAAVVTSTGHWERIGEHWAAALTMVFGSFVAGATPQGGGAVAFPVFTKLLEVPTEAARTFSLCIQAVGMTSAAIAIVVTRRTVVWSAALGGAAVGTVALVTTLGVLGDAGAPFWPMRVPGPYVKVTFTIVLCAMAAVVVLGRRLPIRGVTDRLPSGRRVAVGLVLASAVGGVASALVGSGLDVLLYLFVVVLVGVRPSIGVPTSVVAMALVSLTGLAVLGIGDGQLSIVSSGGVVSAVGGHELSPALSVGRADLFGMWLAAVPVVAWGAPIGSLVAARLSPDHLVRLVLTLAAAEVLSTIVFLPDLRTDAVLALYGLLGAVAAVGGLFVLARNRSTLLDLPELGGALTVTRRNVEVAGHYPRSILGRRPRIGDDEGDAGGRHR